VERKKRSETMGTWDITGNDVSGYRVYDNAVKRFTHDGTFATLE
jgi:hypothetical protein